MPNQQRSWPKVLMTVVKKQALLISLFVIILVFSLLSDAFLSAQNLISILRQVSILGIMSCGLTYVITSGNFDLSAGALLSLVCCVIAKVATETNPVFGMIAGIAAGMLVGLINGYLVGYLKMTSMIVTMAMANVLRTMTLVVTGGRYLTISAPEDRWFAVLGQQSILGIPTQVYIYAIMVIIFQIILTRTPFGFRVKSVGGNATASRYSGIDDRKTIVKAYMLLGFCVAMSAIVQTSRGMAAQNNIGDGTEFECLTAVIIGGTSLLGGEGSVVKSLLGIIMMGVLKNGFIMIGLPYYFQWVAQCVIIIAVVWSDLASKRKKVLV